MLEAVDGFIIVLGTDGHIMYTSESLASLLGYLSSALQGSVLMFTENLFNTSLATEEERNTQTCSSHQDGADTGMEAKDFTSYLIYINIYMIILIMTYFLFFNTEYRREKVDMISLDLHTDVI